MTTRFYKVPGSSEYVTWDYLHNTLGYSTSATETVGYKSVVNWGTSVGTGYCTDTTDYEAEWFVQGETGWAGLNGLAWGCNVYPGGATDIKVERSGTESNAASMTFDGVEYWLVESEIGDAWWPRSRWEQQGWAIVEDHVYEFILVDATTGRVTSGVEHIDEIVFAEAGYFTIDDTDDVIFVEQSPFPIVCTHSGTQTATSIAPDASFDTGLQYYSSKLYIGETDDGQGNVTRYGWEAEEGTAPAYIDVIFAFRWDTSNNEWKTVNFDYDPPDDNFWWGCIVSLADKTAIENFGLTTILTNGGWGGTYGLIVWSNTYTFECLEVYSDLGQTPVAYDISTMDCYGHSASTTPTTQIVLAIRNLQKDATNVKAWKCRITRNS